MFYNFIWSDPEPDPDPYNLNGSGFGSDQKVRIRNTESLIVLRFLRTTGMVGTNYRT